MDIGDIRRLYDIRDLLSLSARRRWIVCPLPRHPHKNYTPSFSIYDGRDGVQRFKCHGNCGAQGDVIDLAGYLWVPGYNPRGTNDVAKAIEMLGIRGNVHIPTSEKTKVVSLGVRAHEKYLPIGEEARAYAHSRGINDESIEKFQIGQDRTWMTMPYFRDGRLRGIKKRNCCTSNQSLRYIADKGSKGDLFNIDSVRYTNGSVLIVKAEIPAILLDQYGFKSVAPTGGEGSWDEQWRTDLGLSRLTVIGDNDGPGRKLAIKRATKFAAVLEFPPKEFKDIDEYMLARPQEARQWLEVLAG
jgi:DNA primase